MNFWLLYIYNIKKTLMISEIILMIRLAMGALLTKHMPPHNSKYDPFPDMLEHIHQKEGGTTNGQVNP